MKGQKRIGTLILALILTLVLAGCGGQSASISGAESGAGEAAEEEAAVPEENTAEADEDAGEAELASAEEPEDAEEDDPVTIRLAAMKGPTAMGLVKLMSDVENGEETAHRNYAFSLAAAPDEVSPLLIKGDLDIACIPANLAAVLYNRTNTGIICLGVNTLGVLYIVENGNAVSTMADLAGKTIVASGKGSTPEYALRYLLRENGVDPDTDVTIDWKSEHAECVAALASGAASIALLPQPFVTVAQSRLENLRVALDLTEEWDALQNGSSLITGVTVAREEFIEAHPAAVHAFLRDYANSAAWVNEDAPGAAALIGGYGIVDAAVAEKALPHCNIVCITGAEMGRILPGYLQVLHDSNPDATGGSLPGDDFYYAG